MKIKYKDIIINIPNSERQECEVWDKSIEPLYPYSQYTPGKKQEFADKHNAEKDKAKGGCR